MGPQSKCRDQTAQNPAIEQNAAGSARGTCSSERMACHHARHRSGEGGGDFHRGFHAREAWQRLTKSGISSAPTCPSWSRTARSKTRCAQDLTSRCISIGVNVKIDTEVLGLSEYALSIVCRSEISRMKGTSLSLPGWGQMASGGGGGPDSGCASKVSRNPGHRPTSHPWPSGRRHSNSASSISVRANNVCNAPSHRSMPTR